MSNYIEQGKTFLEKKEYIKAIEYFQAAIEENPQSEWAYFLLGEAYSYAKKTELAKKTFFALLSINPNHTEALEKVQKLSYPSSISVNSTNRVDFNSKADDPIIKIVPPEENGTDSFWMTEQLSGNKLFYLDNLFEPSCTLVCPEEESMSWLGFEEPKGLIVIPDEVPMDGLKKKLRELMVVSLVETRK